MTQTRKATLLLSITILTLAATFLLHPVRQALASHDFADSCPLCGIPNFGNFATN
ncbi:MAG TPA: hypothetical protein VGR89_08815 [Puia sp.]|nr:hypothetical protein [Puia sp.]